MGHPPSAGLAGVHDCFLQSRSRIQGSLRSGRDDGGEGVPLTSGSLSLLVTSFRAGVEPGPVDKGELQGEAEPGSPERNLREAGVLGDHGDVCREDSDQEEDDAPGCRLAGLADEDADAAKDLRPAAEVDELAMCGEVGWHDAGVGSGGDEVQGPGTDVESTHDEAACAHLGGGLR